MTKRSHQLLFLIGLALRIGLIVSTAPVAVSTWYLPFMSVSTTPLTLDPWSTWIANGGAIRAFPYGYAMWLAFLPMAFVARLTGLPLLYGYAVTLLGADFCLLLTLNKFLKDRQRLLLVTYWLSPIILVATYGLGLNDIIPALLLAAAILSVRRVQLRRAGILCAAAISAKLSMIVALPFFAIYLYNNRALRERLPAFTGGFMLCAAILGIPFLASASGLQMLFRNPEMEKIYCWSLDLGGNVFVYVVPLIYMIIVYLVWRVRRINFGLFQSTTGMAFLLIVLMTPASPGWFVWCLPFLALYQAMSGRLAILLIGLFSGLYAISALLLSPIRLAGGVMFDLGTALHIPAQADSHAVSLLHTIMVAIGCVLAIRIWRESISQNDFFRLSRKPFVIGISGDSGAGKDTLADSLVGLFGLHSTVKLSGDDYHLWDRQKPIWQVRTHLNPMANDLERFCNDLVSLTDGKSIQSHHYDHKTGKMGKPARIKSNDFIIASGLHALYLPILRDCYNLKIFLDIDEDLRRNFKLKRDVLQRGLAPEIVQKALTRRAPDSERFIRSQAVYADLIFALHPIHPQTLENLADKSLLRLKLTVRTRRGFNELSIHRVLVGLCGLHVDMDVGDNNADVTMTIEGETSAADIAMAATLLCPRALEFLDIQPVWQDGIVGLMQLFTLSHISQALTQRFI
jgi:uridine kinase